MWPPTHCLFVLFIVHAEFIPEVIRAAASTRHRGKNNNIHRLRNKRNRVYFDGAIAQSKSWVNDGYNADLEEPQQRFFLKLRKPIKGKAYLKSDLLKRDVVYKPPLTGTTQSNSFQGKQDGKQDGVSISMARDLKTHKLGLGEAEEVFYKRSRNRVKSSRPLQQSLAHRREQPKSSHQRSRTPKRQNIQGGFSYEMPEGINDVTPFIRGGTIKGVPTVSSVGINNPSERMDNFAVELAGKSTATAPFSDDLNLAPSQAIHRYLPGAQHRYLSRPIGGFPFMGGERPMQGNLPISLSARPMLFRTPWSGGPNFGGAHGQHIVVVNRPIKTPVPVPVPVPSRPNVVYVDRPAPVAIRKVPYPIMVPVPQPPRNFIVVHHRPNLDSIIDPCGVNPCRNGGTCTVLGMEFQCICTPGYKGHRCEEQSMCIPNPCTNFGKCTELHDDYECTCHTGYHGKNCDHESKCEPNPCNNGGTCTETLETYICSCAAGYMGKNCEQEAKCLPVNPCQNGGVCNEDMTGYKCNCKDGYRGTNCEVREIPDACGNNPCTNGGTCIADLDDANEFSCYCVPGFSGTTCDDTACMNCPSPARCLHGVCMAFNEMQEGIGAALSSLGSPCAVHNPCLFGGICDPFQDSYICACPGSRRGRHCENVLEMSCEGCDHHAVCELDKCVCSHGYHGDGITCKPKLYHCHPNPCENGGLCHEESSGSAAEAVWWCECPKGYNGKHCQVYDPCSHFFCHNGGRCEVVSHEPTCACQAPWQGTSCEIDNLCLTKDGQDRNPCKNGGTCIFTTNGQTQCSCSQEYEGPTCLEFKCSKCDSHATCDRGLCKCLPNFEGDGLSCKPEHVVPMRAPTPDFCTPVSPCGNGGTCIDGKSTFFCVCGSDFSGRHCELSRVPPKPLQLTPPQLPSVCHPNPCLNGGVCKEEAMRDFECLCPSSQYMGTFCDVDMCAGCDPRARCINGKCICRRGYEGDGYTCKRIRKSCSLCPPGSTCSGVICICNPGLQMTTTGKRSCIRVVDPLTKSSKPAGLNFPPVITLTTNVHRPAMASQPQHKQTQKYANGNQMGLIKSERPSAPTQQWSEDIIVTEYRNLGCWADTRNWRDLLSRSLTPLEAMDPTLMDNYRARKQPISKCADTSKRLGFTLFAIQNGGQCFGGSGNEDYRRYGPSENCHDGVGGPLANDVYKLRR